MLKEKARMIARVVYVADLALTTAAFFAAFFIRDLVLPRMLHAADDHDGVEHQQAGQSHQAEFFTERRGDEIGCRSGHGVRLPVAQTGAEDAAGGETEQRHQGARRAAD